MDYRKMLSGSLELKNKVCNRRFLCIPVLFLNLILLTSVEQLFKKKFLKTSIREERACTGLHPYTILYTLAL